MENILITGALGYLGQSVLNRLHNDMKEGKINSLTAMDVRSVKDSERLKNVNYVELDIRDENLWKHLQKEQITTVIHLAAIIDSQSSPRAFQYEVDVMGTQNILDACLKVAVNRIIISSSGAAYGYHVDNPEWLQENDAIRGNEIFPYSAHKRMVEEMMCEYREKYPQLQQTIFRICTILGKTTDNLITNLFEKKHILGIKGYDSPYVFIWDEDVADCIQQAVFSEKYGVYNLAGDGAICNSDLAILLNKRYLSIPVSLLRWALRVGNKLGLTQYSPDQILFIQYRPVLDNRKLKREFGFVPQKTSLETFLYYLNSRNKTIGDINNINILTP
ncbi:MAG: SDR family oxidoreductase [Saprospiraceae bacterium]|nr:SDR family oxidoreductase [Saprospiraceae bacterium]